MWKVGVGNVKNPGRSEIVVRDREYVSWNLERRKANCKAQGKILALSYARRAARYYPSPSILRILLSAYLDRILKTDWKRMGGTRRAN